MIFRLTFILYFFVITFISSKIVVSMDMCEYESTPYAHSCFFVHAHPDDWIYFRGEVAYGGIKQVYDNQARNKVVFITTTAGDAGKTNGFWEAMEKSTMAAIQSTVYNSPQPIPETKVLNLSANRTHSVQKYTCGNTVSYYMRLPDGNFTTSSDEDNNGSGFPSTEFKSLKKLANGMVKNVKTVDGSNTYYDWPDFVSTLHEIIRKETITEDKKDWVNWINLPDSDGERNPGDHSDHYFTSLAVQQLNDPYPYNLALYKTYATRYLPANLDENSDQYNNKYGIFTTWNNQLSKETNVTDYGSEMWGYWGAKSYCFEQKNQ